MINIPRCGVRALRMYLDSSCECWAEAVPMLSAVYRRFQTETRADRKGRD